MPQHSQQSEKRRTGEYALETIREAGQHGGLWATIISAFALLFSGYSFYESVLKAPALSVYVPPQIAYTDPDRPTSPFEVFILPVTLANDGARTGTVLSLELKVTNPRTAKSKQFYAAQFGPWGNEPLQPFAPISLAGKAAFSRAVQFLPRKGEAVARIMDLEPGDYTFEITVDMAAAGNTNWFSGSSVKPLKFKMMTGQMDYRRFNGTGTQQLWSPNYRSAASR